MTEHFDTIIIGGGIGGTALAALLAHRGQKVFLAERNSVIGGRCTSYERDGFIVDLGVHLFGVGDKGSLGRVLRLVDEPDAIEWVLCRDPKPTMYFKGRSQQYSRAKMSESVPEQQMQKLNELFAKAALMPEQEIQQLWYKPLIEWVNEFTTDPSAQRLIQMINGQYFCVPMDRASTAEFILSFREVVSARSSAYPKGGCISIPRAFQQAAQNKGALVRLNCPVEKIVIQDHQAKGVILADSTRIEAERVVSNADIKLTVNNLAGPEHFPADYMKRIKKLTWANYALGLKVALDTQVTDQKLIMYVPEQTDRQVLENRKRLEEGQVPQAAAGMITSPSNYDPALAPPGKQLIFFGTGCLPHMDWEAWGRVCLEALKKVIPEIEGHILWTKVDSPDDVERYANENGNIIGVGQTIEQIHERRPAHETPVKGLYLCSAEAGGHGIGAELAASSAIELAEKLL